MIGIDISDQSLKVVQLGGSDDRKLLAHCWTALPEKAIENGVVLQPKIVQDKMREALTQCRIPGDMSDAVVVSIPETQSFLRVIEIPQMAEDEIDEAVQWEVAQHIPFGLENVYIDWQNLVGQGHVAVGGKREVQVGAAQKKVVDQLYSTLSVLDLDLAAFELESQALVRALISPELGNRQGLLIIDLGASATNVVIHDHGAMRFTATLQKGVLNISRTSGLTQDDSQLVNTKLHEITQEMRDRLTMKLLPSLEELVIEVRGIVEFYNSIDSQHEVREIILTGGGSNMPGLDKAFLKYFDNVHVQRGNPWVNVLSGNKATTPPMDLKDSVRYTTALGLALRQVVI
ncbi:MAG: type IV pilus assembly protein PilM [Candidatus Andersenbacteria bacterium]